MNGWQRMCWGWGIVLLVVTVCQTASGEIIGPALISRTTIDADSNYLFLYDNGTSTPGFSQWGTVSSWSFYNDNGTAQGGRKIEPVILKKSGSGWLITGVGEPVTTPANMTGVQTFPFTLASGSSVVGPGYTFAHRDLNNPGSIEFDTPSPPSGTHCYLLRGSTSDVVGQVLTGFSTAGRIYSVQFATKEWPMVQWGNPLINRSSNDGAVGGVFVDTREFPIRAILAEWAFFDDDPFSPDRQITPLILQKVGDNYIVQGIGQTRSTTELGEQHYLFNLVAGTDVVGPGYYFGWWDGSTSGTNAGVIDYENTTGLDGIRYFGTVTPTLAKNLGQGTFYARDYSVQTTLAIIPEPSSGLLCLLGFFGLLLGKYRDKLQLPLTKPFKIC